MCMVKGGVGLYETKLYQQMEAALGHAAHATAEAERSSTDLTAAIVTKAAGLPDLNSLERSSLMEIWGHIRAI